MLAIDANVISRYLTGDHLEQSQRARQLIDGRPVFVALTVILEAEWVLTQRLWPWSDRDHPGHEGIQEA